MATLASLLAAAAVAFALARALRLPVIPLLIVAGMILPLLGVRQDAGMLRSVFELGLIFLVFAAGTELTPRRAGRHVKAVLVVGLGQFFAIGAAGFLLCVALGFEVTTSAYLGLALSASSTLVVVRHLKERQQMFEPFGRLVTGILFLQDLLIVLGIVVILRLPDGIAAMMIGLLGTLGLSLLALFCQRWIMPRLIVGGRFGEEERLLMVLALLFVFLGAADLVGVPLVAGAFLAGMTLSGFPLNGVVRGLLRPLSEFFLAVFFIALGAIIYIPQGAGLWLAVALVVFLVVVTPPLVTFLAERQGFSARASIESGLLLSQTSEFSMVIALHGLMLEKISQEVFSIIGLVTVVTMTLTPFLATDRVTWGLMRLHPVSRGKKKRLVLENHVLLLGFGSTGNRLLKPLQEAGQEVVVVDEDAVVVQRLRRTGVPCLRADASDPDALRRVRARRARVIVCTVRRLGDAEKILAYVEESRPTTLVRVFDEEAAERVRELGGVPVESSHAAADSFMEWFALTFHEGGEESEPSDALPDGK